jgi:hypothetical protein
MGESAERKGKNYMQFNSIFYCRVQLVEQGSSNLAEVDCKTVDLLDIPSSQGSSDYSGSPPPCGGVRKHWRVSGRHRVSASKRDKDKESDDAY